MRNKSIVIILTFLIFFVAISNVAAENIENSSDISTLAVDCSDDFISAGGSSSTVNSWADLQADVVNTNVSVIYLNGTNFHPSSQISFNHDLTLVGLENSYVGYSDWASSSKYNYIPFISTSNLNIVFENLTFQYLNDNILIKVAGNGNYTFRNCLFTNINATGSHQSVVWLNSGSALIDNCTFTNCTCSFGAVTNYNEASVNAVHMTVRDSTFTDNYATVEPGAINNCGQLEVINSTFADNYAVWWAGAIHTHNNANTTIRKSRFIDNVAGWNGGALFSYSTLTVDESEFIGNNCTTSFGGGAIGILAYWGYSAPVVTITNCNFTDNYAQTGSGGAITMDGGYLTANNNYFRGNDAIQGNVIAASLTTGTIVNNTFYHNYGRGSDILAISCNDLTIANNTYDEDNMTASSVSISKSADNLTCQITVNTIYSDAVDDFSFDVYVDNAYYDTVNTTVFSLINDGFSHSVYVIAHYKNIINLTSNTIDVQASAIYLSKRGSITGDGSYSNPVNTVSRAVSLALSNNIHNIVIESGTYYLGSGAISVSSSINFVGVGNVVFDLTSVTATRTLYITASSTFKNIVFTNSKKGIFYSTAPLEFINCVFKDNSLTTTNQYSSIIRTTSSLVINDCIFRGNTITSTNQYSSLIRGTSVVINNSIFENNNIYKPMLYITSGNIANSLFANNTISNGQVVQIATSTSVDMSNNIFLSNSVTNYIISKSGSGVVTANDNWWGNTDNDKSTSPNVSGVTLGNWLFLNGTAINYSNYESIDLVLKSYNATSGVVSDYDASDIQTVGMTVSVNNGASCVSSINLVDGQASFNVYNLAANNYLVLVSYYSNNYSLAFSVNNTKLDSFVIVRVKDMVVGGNATLVIYTPVDADGTVSINVNNVIANLPISNGELITTVPSLCNLVDIRYDITVTYNGDDNYNSATNSTFFMLCDDGSQWAMIGQNNNNTGKVDFVGPSPNVVTIWSREIGLNATNVVVDCDGNVYVANGSVLYSFYNNNTLRWNYSLLGDSSFSGLAISRGVIVATVAGDKVYFIDCATGKDYSTANIYQGSSLYAPIVDDKGTVYISGEYQNNTENYILTIIPYDDWMFGNNVITIDLEDNEPIDAPIVMNDDFAVAINTVNGYIFVDFVYYNPLLNYGNASCRPSVSSSGLSYHLLDNYFVVLDPGCSAYYFVDCYGHYLVLDDVNTHFYIVYDDYVLICEDFLDVLVNISTGGVNFSSILVDGDGNIYGVSGSEIYISQNNGTFSFLIDLPEDIVGSLVMSEDGIYACLSNGILYCIGEGSRSFNQNLKSNEKTLLGLSNQDILTDEGDEGDDEGYEIPDWVTSDEIEDVDFEDLSDYLSYYIGGMSELDEYVRDENIFPSGLPDTFTFPKNYYYSTGLGLTLSSYFTTLNENQEVLDYRAILEMDGNNAIFNFTGDVGEIEINRDYIGIFDEEKSYPINITFKNFIFINPYGFSELNPNFERNIAFYNCSFFDCTGLGEGFFENITLVNCSFINCDCAGGKFIDWDYVNLINCSFINCTNHFDNFIHAKEDGVLTNCSFINCSSALLFISKSVDQVNCVYDNLTNYAYLGDYEAPEWVTSDEIFDVSWTDLNKYLNLVYKCVDDENINYNHLNELNDVFVLPRNHYIYNSGQIPIAQYLNHFEFDDEELVYDSYKIKIFDGNNSIIDANGLNPVFFVLDSYYETKTGVSDEPLNITIQNFIFANHESSDTVKNFLFTGESRFPSYNIIFFNCTFVNCSSDYFVNAKGISLDNCSFVNCSAKKYFITSEDINLNNCSFVNCSSSDNFYRLSYSSSEYVYYDFYYGFIELKDNNNIVNCKFDMNGGFAVIKTWNSVALRSRAGNYMPYLSQNVRYTFPSNVTVKNNIILTNGSYAIYEIPELGVIEDNYLISNMSGDVLYGNDAIYLKDRTDISFVSFNVDLINYPYKTNITPSIEGSNLVFTLDASDNGNLTLEDGTIIPITAGTGYTPITVTPGQSVEGTITGYLGEKYYALSSDYSLTAPKLSPNLNITTDNLEFEYNQSIEIAIELEAATNNETNISIYDEDGKVIDSKLTKTSATFTNLAAGTYTVNVTYLGDDKYLNETVTDTLTVTKATPELGLEVENTTATLKISITPSIDENITINVNGDEYKLNKTNKTFTLNNKNEGKYYITATFNGNENYTSVSENKTVTLSKADSNLKVNAVVNNGVVNISSTLTPTTGEITYIVNNKQYTKAIGENLTINDLAPGEYTVFASYAGDLSYKAGNANYTFNISDSRTTPTIDAKDVIINEGDNALINVSVAGASGDVVVIIGDTKYLATLNDEGKATVTVVGLTDTVSANINYTGDKNNKPVNKTITITVNKVEPIEPIDSEFKATVTNNTINVSVNPAAEGYVLVNVEDICFYSDVKAGEASIDVVGLVAGNYSATVSFVSSNGFTNNTTTVEVNIPKEDEPVIKDANLTATATNTTITVSVDKDATGNILVDVAGQGYYAQIKNGEAIIEVTGLEAGKSYLANVTYSGNGVFAPANTTVTVSVPKKEDPQPVDPKADIKITNTTVDVILPEDAKGYVLVDVDDAVYYVPVEDGNASFDLPELAPGDHKINVTYSGDEKYAPANATTTINIPEEPVVEPLDPELKVTVENATVTISLNENATGYVLVYLNEDDDMIYDFDGEDIVIDIFFPGNYTVDVNYLGDDTFAPANATVTVEVPEIEPLNPELKAVVENTTVTISLNENATGFVLVEVTGDTLYYELSGEDIVVDLSDLAPGNYTVEVMYSGDDVFAEANATAKVTVPGEPVVEPKDSGLKVDIDDTVITVSINDTATGDVIVSVGDISFVSDASELAPIDVSEYLPSGTYSVSVKYVGDSVFAEKTLIGGNLTVPEEPVIEPKDPELKATATNTTITVNVNKDATGNVLVDINGQGYYAPIKDGQAIIEVTGLEAGKSYDATVTYAGDDNFAAANTTVTVTVPKKEDPQPVDPKADIKISDDGVNVTLPEDATGYILVDVDDAVYYVPVEDGKASFDLPELAPGNHTVKVTYSGDDKYAPANATGTVNVPEEPVIEPKDSGLKVDIKDTVISVSINASATGDVIVTVGNISFVQDAQALSPIDVSEYLPSGTYPVSVKYVGDDVFAEKSVIGGNVTVPEEPVIEPKDPELKASVENTTVTISLNSNATGAVLVDVGDSVLYYEFAGEDIVVDLSNLASGNYTVDISYLGDDIFAEANTTAKVSVPEEPVIEPKDAELTATATNTTINVSVNKDATGNVLVDINGQGYYAPIKDGKATVNVIGLDEGEYQATITYAGDEVFAPANATVAVTVAPSGKNDTPVDPKADINISADGITVTLPEDATGYVLVDVDDTTSWAPVKDGKASFELPELAPGNHTVGVTYTGDKKYDAASATETITVESPEESIFSEDLIKVEKAPDRFEANFTDAEGNPLANASVTFEINGNVYTRTTDAKGKAGMNINLEAGNYTVIITNPVTGEVKNNTITVLSRFEETNDLVKYFRNDSQYVIKVLGDDGKIAPKGTVVTFNINGVFYNRTVDESGHVKLSINLNPGEYTITAEYKGCRVSNNITVLPVLTGNDLTKKYGQAGAYEATLVDGQGKPYAGQEVEFNINGVFYKRTTDSNGVAKLNINLMPGKYIITATYGAAAISNNVTVTP